jgi:hypothetical protein
MNIEELRQPLTLDQIDFRVQSVNRGGYALILAYKDARVDINRLTNVCGALGWKREHTRDNKNCIVSVWDDERKHWVSKEDTGTESNTEQQKGLASDSFKRACFNWGIGIELYDYPMIKVKLKDKEWELKEKNGKKYATTTYEFNLKSWNWQGYWHDGKLVELIAVDENRGQRFKWPNTVKSDDIDWKHVDACFEMLKEEVDSDKDEPDYGRMQTGMGRLNDDEQIAVLNKFGKDRPQGSQKMYKSIINECLNEVIEK